MIRNRRGQVFSLLIVLFALFSCGTVIALYIIQQGNAQASLVSPREVLETRTELDILELKEIEILRSSLKSVGGDFGSAEFRDSLRVSFIDGVMSDGDMRNFLFEDLLVGGVEVREQDKNKNLLENAIYPEELVSFDGERVSFGRADIEKRSLLVARSEKSKIDFPVRFSFKFGQKYFISKIGDGFEVAKV